MVGRIYRAKKCLKYMENEATSYPVLKLKLYNILGMEFPEEMEVPIDTGFEGSLMLRNEDYRFFMIGELPRDFWRTYSTLAGSIIMRIAKAIVVIDNIKFETYVETPYLGYGRRLIGREILNNLTLILDGLRKKCCIVY